MPLKKDGYKPRLADKQLEILLRGFGAVCIEGPKWCGKTWTGLNRANSAVFIASPENNFQYRELARLSPELILEGNPPLLIDEWQEVTAIWDAVRFAVDQESSRGRFIMTGSSTPATESYVHSGAGRIARLRLQTMSLFESNDSSGSVSLKTLFTEGLNVVKNKKTSLEDLIALTIRGGWPGSIGMDLEAAKEIPKQYLDSVLEKDMLSVGGSRRDTDKFRRLIRSLARNESTVVSYKTLQNDMVESEGESIDANTIASYLEILDRLFILENQPAYNPNLRSAVRVGKSAKRHFTDPSLAIAALGATPEILFNDLNTFGFLFEALCERDLRIYAQAIGGKLFHYRDGKGREIDAVIELEDGKWGAFEIKLGTYQLNEAASGLLKLKQEMEADLKAKAPAVLCVICGLADFAYKRDDGVFVVPITALKD
jgi:predicted AAA+ superfamily ATPase